jgi:conjugal transfer pilus assembly protein TrbC
VLRFLMLITLLAAVDSTADVDALRQASDQADRAQTSAQSALEQAERGGSTRAETTDDALQRAGTLPALDLPLLERALADPQRLASIGALLEDAQVLATALHEPRAADEHMAVYVFASFSMPDVSLRALIRQGELAGVPIVLRGLVEDSVESTIERVHGLYDQEESQAAGVLIDPTLFARFDIDQVPTVVVAETAARPCTRETCPVPPHVKIAGDVPLRYALARIASARPAYRNELRPLLSALEPGKTW